MSVLTHIPTTFDYWTAGMSPEEHAAFLAWWDWNRLRIRPGHQDARKMWDGPTGGRWFWQLDKPNEARSAA